MSTINKPRLLEMVACKTVNEYDTNQRKLRRFYIEELAVRAALTQPSRPNPVNPEPLGIQKCSRFPKQIRRNSQNKRKQIPIQEEEEKR